MAATGELLAALGIGFLMEEPGGLDAREVERMAAAAKNAGVYTTVPLVSRISALIEQVVARAGAGGVDYASFRFIARPPGRYEEIGCGWLLDPAQAGGGPTRHHALHFFDLFEQLTGAPSEVDAALMSSRAWGLGIEDYSVVTLRAGSRVAVVETGYNFPDRALDLRFSLRSAQAYFVVPDAETLEVITVAGRETMRPVTTVLTYSSPLTASYFARLASDFRAGRPCVADVHDLARLARLADAAYLKAGRPAAP
jgi:predicted dehydrogenase